LIRLFLYEVHLAVRDRRKQEYSRRQGPEEPLSCSEKVISNAETKIYQKKKPCKLKCGRPSVPEIKILMGTLEEFTFKIDKETLGYQSKYSFPLENTDTSNSFFPIRWDSPPQ